MAVMSTVERWACTNRGWRAFTARVVVPWVVAGRELEGEVLELGSGAGANAAALLARFPAVRLTATDLDPAMLARAERRLVSFGERVAICEADARSLPFEDGRFDAVVSLLMLHHIGDWRRALAECARVLRPGGRLLGYDLDRGGPAGRHRREDPGHHLVSVDELRSGLASTGLDEVDVTRALVGTVARFSARRLGG